MQVAINASGGNYAPGISAAYDHPTALPKRGLFVGSLSVEVNPGYIGQVLQQKGAAGACQRDSAPVWDGSSQLRRYEMCRGVSPGTGFHLGDSVLPVSKLLDDTHNKPAVGNMSTVAQLHFAGCFVEEHVDVLTIVDTEGAYHAIVRVDADQIAGLYHGVVNAHAVLRHILGSGAAEIQLDAEAGVDQSHKFRVGHGVVVLREAGHQRTNQAVSVPRNGQTEIAIGGLDVLSSSGKVLAILRASRAACAAAMAFLMAAFAAASASSAFLLASS